MKPTVAELFSALASLRQVVAATPMADAFAADPQRFAKFHVVLDDLLFDYSKQRINSVVLDRLHELAGAAGVEERRNAMFRGEIVNPTEKRAALHTALRDLTGKAI